MCSSDLDLQGQALQHRNELDRALTPRCEIGNQRIGGRGDVLRQNSNRPRRECRGERPPLMLPFLARAEEQSIAEDRAENPDRRRRAGIVRGVIDKDMADRVGLAENELASAK